MTSRHPQLNDPEWLCREYAEEGRTCQNIAADLGCDPGLIHHHLRRHGIPVRAPRLTSNASKYPQLHDREWLRHQYEDLHKNGRVIAAEIHCSTGAVLHHLREFGIPVRGRHHGRWKPRRCERCDHTFTPSGPASRFCSPACRAGTRRCSWCAERFAVPQPKGSKRAVSQKRFCSKTCLYEWRKDTITRLPTHHRRFKADGYVDVNLGPSRGRVGEHRLVVEQIFGRELLPDETVHHRNGVKDDNRPGNLELWAGVGRQPAGQRAADLLAWAEEIVARYTPVRDKL